MLQRTHARLGKKPVNRHLAKGMISDQIKVLMNKPHVKPSRRWEDLENGLYDPRRLQNADVKLDAKGAIRRDPHRQNSTYYVPDQKYVKIPVPEDYKDAYWHREWEARRVQTSVEDKIHLTWKLSTRSRTDFQDLSFRPKFQFSVGEVLELARRDGH
eukprot:PhM_4_TR7088/c0_g1_i1/m.55959